MIFSITTRLWIQTMVVITDWQCTAQHVDDRTVLIPAGTKFYRGVECGSTYDSIVEGRGCQAFTSKDYSFFTTFPSAGYYAFASRVTGEHGKIVEFALTRDLRMMNLSSLSALELLWTKTPPQTHFGNLLTYMFGYQPGATRHEEIFLSCL